MSAPGRPKHYNGDAPDPVAAPASVQPTVIEFDRTVQKLTIKNAEPLLGGADLHICLDNSNLYFPISPGDGFWEENLTIKELRVISGTIGATAAYRIVAVEQ